MRPVHALQPSRWAVPPANLAERPGLFSLLEDVAPAKERNRGYSNSTAVFDLMSIVLSGGPCIDERNQQRLDAGLVRLFGRKPMALSTAHDFPRRNRHAGLAPLCEVHCHLLRQPAERTATTTAPIGADASLFASGRRFTPVSLDARLCAIHTTRQRRSGNQRSPFTHILARPKFQRGPPLSPSAYAIAPKCPHNRA